MTDSNQIFDYLAVLFSIILGLAVTEILQGFRRSLLARRRIILYWPALLWGFILLVVCAQTWWALFGLHDESDWTFGKYAIVLTQTALLYMVAGLSLPGTDEESDWNMRSAYFDNSRPFYLLLVAMISVSLAKDLVISGHFPDPLNLVFHGLFVGCALVAAVTRNDRYHKVNALLVAFALAAYVVALFDRIG